MPNNPPDVTANADPESVREGGEVSLTGMATDPEGHDMRFRWQQLREGPRVSIGNDATLNAGFVAPDVTGTPYWPFS